MLSAILVCLIATFALCPSCQGTIYFEENFNDDSWSERWVVSDNKANEGTAGKLSLSAGEFFGDENDLGLKTTEDARFYEVSASFPKFSNRDKTLVFQFSVKHEQKIDCGGGYFKLLRDGYNPKTFNGDTEYAIMFGPDICGFSTKRVHAILNYKGENHLIKDTVECKTDKLTHMYQLVITPDNRFVIKIDGETSESGDILEHWSVLPPKEVKDPKESKPADWVDEATIPDPDSVKPDDWDVPEFVPDADAEKPEDWDDELDGDWVPPTVPNPDFKGEWEQATLPNPAYKGPWVHPMIPNPDYVEDLTVYAFDDISGVGLEIWQVLSGTVFDNLLITDDVEYADKEVSRVMELMKIEKDLFDAKEAEEKFVPPAGDEGFDEDDYDFEGYGDDDDYDYDHDEL